MKRDNVVRLMCYVGLMLSGMCECSCSRQPVQTPQGKLVGGPCEGCEAVLEYGNRMLAPVDTLPGFEMEGTPICVRGTIYQTDKTTPASDVMLYVYHTDQNGHYTPQGDTTGWAKRHGYIRAWIKTDASGQYAFYSLMPAPYPDYSEPAHIHAIILEPDGRYYWLENYYFEGDSLLTDKQRDPASPRGGSHGVLQLVEQDGILTGTRDLVLGKHIPSYN